MEKKLITLDEIKVLQKTGRVFDFDSVTIKYDALKADSIKTRIFLEQHERLYKQVKDFKEKWDNIYKGG